METFNTQQLAKFLNIQTSHVRRWIENGEAPEHTSDPFGKPVFSSLDVYDWLEYRHCPTILAPSPDGETKSNGSPVYVLVPRPTAIFTGPLLTCNQAAEVLGCSLDELKKYTYRFREPKPLHHYMLRKDPTKSPIRFRLDHLKMFKRYYL